MASVINSPGLLSYLVGLSFILLLRAPLSIALDDWLLKPSGIKSSLIKISPDTLRLTNGLVRRDFQITPDFFTVDFFSEEKQQSLLRAISPECEISIDGLFYTVGGIVTDTPRAYLNRTHLASNIAVNPNAFHFVGYEVGNPKAPYPYRPKRSAPQDIVWPPAGLRMDVEFRAPFWAPYYHQQVVVVVHYEIYDGIPLISKWVSIEATPEVGDKVRVFVVSVESMAVNWQWANNGYGWLHVENDMPHTNVQWFTDPSHGAMPGSFETSFNCTYPSTGLVPLSKGFTSFRVHLLVVGTNDPERYGLALRKKLRLLAPQIQENPIFFHMTSHDSKMIRAVVDQMQDVGFEMMIFSFGSGFDLESDDPGYLKQLKDDIKYANDRNIEVGGYDLIVWTRGVKQEWMDVGADGACIASGWYDYLLERTLQMMDYTGLSMVETDGPYPGYTCSSTNHSHHKDKDDSVYWQLTLQAEYFKILREKEIYINQPDEYFYYGGNKDGMGYDESQYSLPRWQDLSVSRQGMFDDTFHFTPSVGWMFLPLVQYHGGGEAAQFEPLKEHLVEYEWGLAMYFGAGVAACYRGYRLYDCNETRAIVIKWVSFFKKYRDILTSDIIHVKRADMQSVDSFMHVNPYLKDIKGLAMVFNPTYEHIKTNLTIPLYYTGISNYADVAEQDGSNVRYQLDRGYNIEISVDMQPLSITWFTIRGADE